MFFRDADDQPEAWEADTSPAAKPRPSQDLTTSWGRFHSRLESWKSDGKAFPRSRHHLQWFIHNLVVHPLIAFFPTVWLLEFHELSSKWLNVPVRKSFVLTSPKVPNPKSRFFWVLHNSVGHVLIGLLPIRPMFFFHDWSAKQMGTPNWF